MNAPDTNLLLYAYNGNDPRHQAASSYLEQSLSSEEAYGIPLLSAQGFIRISTTTSFGPARLTLATAFAAVQSWVSRPNVRILYPGPEHWAILSRLSLAANAVVGTFTDAAIAAIAVEHGAIVHGADNHFSRFPGLRWNNPLANSPS